MLVCVTEHVGEGVPGRGQKGEKRGLARLQPGLRQRLPDRAFGQGTPPTSMAPAGKAHILLSLRWMRRNSRFSLRMMPRAATMT